MCECKCECGCRKRERELAEHLRRRREWVEAFHAAGGKIPEPSYIGGCSDLEFVLGNMIANISPEEAARANIIYWERRA